MYKYEIIIHWSEEDQGYIAEVPELPGCMADGETYEEAVKNVQVIISEWIETAEAWVVIYQNLEVNLCMCEANI